MRCASMYIVLVLCLIGLCASAPETGDAQVAYQSQELVTKAAYFLPLFDQASGHCEVTCNNKGVDTTGYFSTSEPKTCVGTLQVFCRGNGTAGTGVAGMKCEGKSTFFRGLAICEGALQNFVKKGFTTPEGKLIKSTKAYGCLGTSVGASFNGSSNTYTEGFASTDALEMEAALADEKRSVEGRCDGLSVQFQAAKVVGACDKHVSKGSKKADRQQPAEEQLRSAEAVNPSFEFAQSDGAHIQLPGARRSLAGHHDKHSKKGKRHDDSDDDDDNDRKDDDQHHKQQTKKDLKHNDKHCHMTFEDAEGKVQQLMHKSGVEWLPRELPSGSGQLDSSRPDCTITCNGRRTWFGAFFPCFGELKVDCEGGSRSLPTYIAGSNLDTTQGADQGFDFHGACKGYWSGALFKSCTGFSTAHVEVNDKEVWDFCSGKKVVRMGAMSGKGFFSSSACRGKDLLVVEKEDEQML